MILKYAALGLVISLSACATQPERVNTIVKTPLGTQVIAPNCPDWSKASGGDFENKQSSNYGCSTITNYGVMIENPEDMIKGRGTPFGNASQATRSVSAYEGGGAAAPAASGGAPSQ